MDRSLTWYCQRRFVSLFTPKYLTLSVGYILLPHNLIFKSPSNFFCLDLKLVSAIFYHVYIFHQSIALQKLWKMFFISSAKLFLFSRYSNFCIFVFHSSLPCSHCLRDWSKKSLKIYDVINGLSKDLITHFVWYHEKEIRCGIETLSIDRELNKEHFHGKIMHKTCTKS